MSSKDQPFTGSFSIDVTSNAGNAASNPSSMDQGTRIEALLHELVKGQDRQNELLEELVGIQVAQQKQRAAELNQWKRQNPELANSCAKAARSLSQVQSRFLERLVEEIEDSEEALFDGDYMFGEFVDRYGPRLAHLSGVLQTLSQLSANSKS